MSLFTGQLRVTALRYSALHTQQVDVLMRLVDRHPIADSYRVVRLDLAELLAWEADLAVNPSFISSCIYFFIHPFIQ